MVQLRVEMFKYVCVCVCVCVCVSKRRALPRDSAVKVRPTGHGPTGPRPHGLTGPRAHGPATGPRARPGPTGPRAHGPTGPRAHGRHGPAGTRIYTSSYMRMSLRMPVRT